MNAKSQPVKVGSGLYVCRCGAEYRLEQAECCECGRKILPSGATERFRPAATIPRTDPKPETP